MNIAILCSSLALFSYSHAADFELGFEINEIKEIFDPLDYKTYPGNCGIGGVTNGMCGIGGAFTGWERADPDTTPFYQGEIMIDGKMYWHIIVGDPASGFAMESYTEQASGTGFGSFSGGEPANFSATSLEGNSGSGWDPLGMNNPSRGVDFTGNGSGDPTRTVFRQVMGNGTWDAQNRTWSCGTGEFCSEILKDRLDGKPLISQAINDDSTGPLLQLRFQLDMRNLSYSSYSQAGGSIINTVSLTDPSDDEFYLVDANFDMATDTEDSFVTAGSYVYNNCSNPSGLYGGSCWQKFSVYGGVNNYQEGSYTYSDGNTDPMAYNWGSFFDPAQNTFSGGGSGSGNQDKCTKAGANPPDTCSPLF